MYVCMFVGGYVSSFSVQGYLDFFLHKTKGRVLEQRTLQNPPKLSMHVNWNNLALIWMQGIIKRYEKFYKKKKITNSFIQLLCSL